MNTTTRNALGASCALALACSALAGCAKPTPAATPRCPSDAPGRRQHRRRQDVAAAPAPADRARAGTGRSPRRREAPGSIEAMPEKLVKITPPLAGRITRLQRALGDSVKAGEPLFTLDSAELSAAYADDSKAKSALLQARQELERQKTLFEAEIAARKEYEAAQAAFDAGPQRRAGQRRQAGPVRRRRARYTLRPPRLCAAFAHRRHRDRHGRRPGRLLERYQRRPS